MAACALKDGNSCPRRLRFAKNIVLLGEGELARADAAVVYDPVTVFDVMTGAMALCATEVRELVLGARAYFRDRTGVQFALGDIQCSDEGAACRSVSACVLDGVRAGDGAYTIRPYALADCVDLYPDSMAGFSRTPQRCSRAYEAGFVLEFARDWTSPAAAAAAAAGDKKRPHLEHDAYYYGLWHIALGDGADPLRMQFQSDAPTSRITGRPEARELVVKNARTKELGRASAMYWPREYPVCPPPRGRAPAYITVRVLLTLPDYRASEPAAPACARSEFQ